MTDDELRRLLHEAHGDEAPPALSSLLAREPPRRPRWALAAVVAAAVVALFVALRPRGEPPRLARLDVAWSAPLDFLLDVPGTDLLRATPRFELKGTLP